MPFAIQTNQWAFHDTGIASGKLNLGPNGYAFPHNPLYLWFADRKTNPVYSHPDLFVCYVTQDMSVALQRYLYPDKSLQMCFNYPIVRQALGLVPNRLEHQLMKRDEKEDMWAIIKINWDFPPYLIVDNKTHESVKVSALREKNNIKLDIQYSYKQQNGVKEDSSLVELRSVTRRKYSCSFGPAIIQTNVHGGKVKLQFSEKTGVDEYVVVVTPKSVSKVGDQWTSAIIDVSNGEIKVGSECRRWGK